jgi:hypothetical protein
VTVTPEDDEVINTLSGHFTQQLADFADEREASLGASQSGTQAGRRRAHSFAWWWW